MASYQDYLDLANSELAKDAQPLVDAVEQHIAHTLKGSEASEDTGDPSPNVHQSLQERAASGEKMAQWALDVKATDDGKFGREWTLTTELTPPQQAALNSFLSRAPRIIDEARAITITDEPSLQRAVTLQQDVKAAIDLLEAFKRPEINRAYQAHKAALGELQALTAPWRTADTILSTEAGAYQLRLRREREEAARRVHDEMQRVRDQDLARQLEQAAQAGVEEQVQEVLERAATPLPEIPIVHTPVRVEGSITRGKHTFTIVDVRKINLQWVLECILAEIATKGECKWLSTQIGKEVRSKGKRAEEVVGVGSIEYSAGVSAGVRRRKP